MKSSRVNRSLSRTEAVQPAASPLSTCGPAPRRKPSGSHCALPRSEIPPPIAALGPAASYRSTLDSSLPTRLLKCAVCRFSGQQTQRPFPPPLGPKPGLLCQIPTVLPTGSAPDTHFRRRGGRDWAGKGAGRAAGGHDVGPPDTEPCLAQGEQRSHELGAAAAVRESQPTGPGASAGLPRGLSRNVYRRLHPASGIFDPGGRLHEVLRGQILERHPKGGIFNQPLLWGGRGVGSTLHWEGEPHLKSLPAFRGRAETGLWQEWLENNWVWTARVWRDGCEPLLSAQTRPCLALIHKELSSFQLLGPDTCLESLAVACFYHPTAFALCPATQSQARGLLEIKWTTQDYALSVWEDYCWPPLKIRAKLGSAWVCYTPHGHRFG